MLELLQIPNRTHSVEAPANGAFGYLHSVETGSAVDGPGLRMVLFTSGCLLRCQFCHNPDTWHRLSGTPRTAEQLFEEIAKYADFLKTCNGGVTFSGGEPLVQAPFVMNVLRRVKQELGLHTAIQTAAFLGDRVSDEQLEYVDLWMVDFKHPDPEQYKRITGVEQPNMIKFLHRLARHNRPMWVTYVLVPHLTDQPAAIDRMARFLSPLKNIERVEIRPFHQLGRHKWAALGVDYPLADTLTPDRALLTRVTQQLESAGLPVIVA